MSEATTTTDHAKIKAWIEARGGHPARVRTEGPGGILRVDFGEPEDRLETIDWEQFFEIFEQNKLAFLHQDETREGEESRFNKFVERDG